MSDPQKMLMMAIGFVSGVYIMRKFLSKTKLTKSYTLEEVESAVQSSKHYSSQSDLGNVRHNLLTGTRDPQIAGSKFGDSQYGRFSSDKEKDKNFRNSPYSSLK